MLSAKKELFTPSGGGYQISRSVRLRNSASGSFSRTPASASNRTTWTWSAWVKRGELTRSTTGGVIGIFGGGNLGAGVASFQVYFNSAFDIYIQDGVMNVTNHLIYQTTSIYRDPSAWYHIIIAMDTTQATAANRTKVYVNGVQAPGAFSVTPAQNQLLSINNNVPQYIGGAPVNPQAYGNVLSYFDGYLAELNFIDGQQLTPSSFGETNAITGVWQPKRYAGTYGTNGYYLPFLTDTATTSVSASYLIVGGGGGGNGAVNDYTVAAGGGGGGVLTGTGSLSLGQSYSVTVGLGGAGMTYLQAGSVGNGGSSVFNGLTAVGGGGGASFMTLAGNGGSGGGGGADFPTGGTGTSGQGNNGGTATNFAGKGAGGGGGAGGVGSNASTNTGGNGGVGVASSITGSSVTYGGGGGGAGASVGGTGGAGGGGNGAVYNGDGGVGTPNRGGGGGGAARNNAVGQQTGGAGGSGVVIISYAGTQKFSGGTVTSSGGNTIHTFTSSGALSSLGIDFSGNNNHWTSNNISLTAGATYDSLIDVPTLYDDTNTGRGNYCTLNPLYKGSSVTPTEGNLKFGMVSGNFHEGITGTIFPTSGKWYAEFRWNAVTAATTATAVCRNNAAMNTVTCAFQNTVDTNSPTYRSYVVNGNKDTNTTSAAYGSTYTANDTIGVALDLDNGKVWFSKNGAWQASGDPAAGTNAAFTDITGSDGWTFGVSGYGSGGDNCHANFGQRPFTYTPPTGFKALNTQNLPTAPINKGNLFFDATTYTGTGAARSIQNAGTFSPDLVWCKSRSNAFGHSLYDTLRGATKYISTDATTAEITDAVTVTSFNSDGFSVGSSTGINSNGATYVAWQWDAGDTTVTNTSGSISAQVRANPTAGFSVVTYTGTGANATVGHGLGVAPRMIIVKSRSLAGQNWHTYHAAIDATSPANFIVVLNGTVAKTTSAASWNNTAPTSSVFSVGTDTSVNNSTSTYVAYCFSEVAGYSKFGNYTGNGSTDGPFVFTGFRPKFVLIKRTDSTGNWFIWDTSRNTFNAVNNQIYPDGSSAEAVQDGLDFLSNGFKIRFSSTFADRNASGGTYIYMAFAENPFKNSLAR